MKWKLIPTKHAGIFRREGDRRYVIRGVGVCQKTGKIKELTRVLPEGFTERQALEALADLKGAARAGEGSKPAAAVLPTLAAYVPLWSARQLSRGKWNPDGGTASTIGWRLDKYVIPRLGDYILDRITYTDLQVWLDWLSTEVSPRTARNVFGNLRCIIREGRKDYGCPPLPAFPEPPLVRNDRNGDLTWDNFRKEQGCALTKDELGRFLDAAKAISLHGWYAFCVLGFGSDARFSELAAIEAGDLDLSEAIGVWLCRRHLVNRESRPGIKWNRKGVVRLLDAETTRILRPFVRDLEPSDLLFPSDQSGCTYRSNKGLQWFLDQVAEKANLPRMTSKVFRRTFLTLSHLNTMADAMAQAQAGHSDPKTTAAYHKPSLAHRTEHARKMAGVLYAVPEPPKDE